MDTFSVIISGVAIFIVGEIFVRFFLGPIHKFKEIKGEIAGILLFHANNYGHEYKKLEMAFNDLDENNGNKQIVIDERIKSMKQWNDDLSRASDETRAIAAKLISAAEGIPFYKFVSCTKMVPAMSNVLSAKKHLIGLSNSFSADQAVASAERSEKVCKLLNIEFMNE